MATVFKMKAVRFDAEHIQKLNQRAAGSNHFNFACHVAGLIIIRLTAQRP